MKRNTNLLISSSANILIACRKPIRITLLINKTFYGDNFSFYYYFNHLIKNNLLTVQQEGRNKEVTITDKGREFLKYWIDVNKLIGVSICLYL